MKKSRETYRFTMNHIMMVFLLVLSTTACATLGKTSLESVWQDEELKQGSIQSIMILGIAEKIENRRLYEETFVTYLSDSKIKAVSSLELISEKTELTPENVRDAALKNGIDAVLVTHVIESDTSTDFYRTPGSNAPSVSYYHSYDDYYSSAQSDIKKGHYIERVNAVLESNIYRVEDKKLLWSARSNTMDSDSPKNLIESVIKEIINSFN